jgi:hypothetical protein
MKLMKDGSAAASIIAEHSSSFKRFQSHLSLRRRIARSLRIAGGSWAAGALVCHRK